MHTYTDILCVKGSFVTCMYRLFNSAKLRRLYILRNVVLYTLADIV